MPTGSRWAVDAPSGSSNSRPVTAQPIQRKSMARREDSTATVSGPVNSMAMASPSGTVRRDI
ncbi:hypothetical protein D3C72_1373120 [compost metagenome]